MVGAAANIALAHTVVGLIGNITSFGVYLAPLPTFVQIVRWRSTKEFSGIPYLATLLNALLWVLYGLPFIHPNSMLVATVNIAGAVVEIAYIAIFIHYTNKCKRKKAIYILLGMLLAVTLVVVLTLLLAHTYEMRTLVVGSICVVVGIAMYGAPLTVMGQVIRTKSVEYMPFHFSLICFLNASVWSTYAALHFDIFIMICNGVGVILTASQLVLYAFYYCLNSTSFASNDHNLKKHAPIHVPNPKDVDVEKSNINIELSEPTTIVVVVDGQQTKQNDGS